MSTVVLVLAGVLQSWGTTTIGHSRATNHYPTKSGVIGLIANAMGRERNDDISDLASSSFGVRVDSPGVVQRDYHTVSILKQPTKGDRIARVTERFYLSDAVFVVALSNPNEALVEEIALALKKPSRTLFLGRKSCPPTRPVLYGISASDCISALNETPWQSDQKTQDGYLAGEVSLDVFRDPIDSDEGFMADVVTDQPLSFDSAARRYASRGVYRTSVTIPVFRESAKPSSVNFMDLAIRAAGE